MTSEEKSKNMRAVKSAGSKIEQRLSKALWNNGLRFRKNVKDIFGKPDIAIKKYKIVIFADSEFWHGKNWEERKKDFKSNRSFWIPKIERNIQRDKEVTEYLEKNGWVVLRFWGNDIKNDIDNVVREVIKVYKDRRNE